jgi:hypothetical protein
MAVAQMLRPWQGAGGFAAPIQTKLTVNTPGDRFEQEADRVADRVMRMADVPGQEIQRKCGVCEEEEKKLGARQSVEGQSDEYDLGQPMVQMMAAPSQAS